MIEGHLQDLVGKCVWAVDFDGRTVFPLLVREADIDSKKELLLEGHGGARAWWQTEYLFRTVSELAWRGHDRPPSTKAELDGIEVERRRLGKQFGFCIAGSISSPESAAREAFENMKRKQEGAQA